MTKDEIRKEAQAYAKSNSISGTDPEVSSMIRSYIAGRSVSEEENEKLRKEIEDREDKWQSFHDKRIAEVTKERDQLREALKERDQFAKQLSPPNS